VDVSPVLLWIHEDRKKVQEINATAGENRFVVEGDCETTAARSARRGVVFPSVEGFNPTYFRAGKRHGYLIESFPFEG
jgi:hypothetical protein